MSTRLLLFLLLLLAIPTHATTLLLGEGVSSLHGHLELLNDASGRDLAPQAAMEAKEWRPLVGGLQAGFTATPQWLRVTVRRGPGTADEWVLQLSNALIDDVRLYQRDASGSWDEQRSGEDLPRSDWPADYRTPVFPLALPPDEPTVLLLQLRSKNALAVALDIWPEVKFDNFSRRESLAYGLFGGFCLLLVLFHIAFWRMTRAPESGWYLAYLSTILTTTVLSSGLPQQFSGMPVWFSDPLLGCSLTIGSLPVGAIFTMRQLQIRPIWPHLEQALVGTATLIGAVAAAAVLYGRYGIGAPLAQITSLGLIPLFIGMAVILLRRGHAPARFFLFAFSIFYAGVVVAYLRNLGALPANVWTDNATSIGTLLHMSIMSLRIISHYNQLKRERGLAQEAAIDATRLHNDRLEQQVAVRTAALRAALANETRTHQEQRDFVAMVSHEFRTPLAIIDTSAQQIARNLDAAADKTLRRCANIRDAVNRMLAQVDDYLTEDRMEGQPALRSARVPWGELLNEALDEWPARVLQENTAPEIDLICDRGLLLVALRNLFANADRHALPTTQIRLHCELQSDGDLRIRIANSCARAIPFDERGRLFEKYYRGRQSQHSPGAGLGLYLVRRIARLHGGEVILEEGGDKGTVVFCIALPAEAIIVASRNT